MNIHFSNLWNQLRANFWLLPALMTLAAFGLSFLTINWDRNLDNQDVSIYSIWQGGAEGARQLLSAIASSIITITGVVFSLTIVSLGLASTQYGSGILRNFMKDIGTQIVLGTFISTSIYALLILRTIRGDVHPFIPNLSITISLGFALLSLSMLIYFIHHLSVRLQSSDIIVRIANDLNHMIEDTLKDDCSIQKINKDNHHEKEYKIEILSSKIGYLQAVEYQLLINIAQKKQFAMELYVRPGSFIRKESLLAKVASPDLTEQVKQSIYKAFLIGKERNSTQDIEYMIDQLVAIALRALSKNANDNFTANSCIDQLGAALCLISKKELNPPYYANNSYIKLISQLVTFEGLIDASFNQIRQHASFNPSILIHLLETLLSILTCTQTYDQKNSLKKHAIMIENAGNRLLEEKDRLDVKERSHKFNLEFEKRINEYPKK